MEWQDATVASYIATGGSRERKIHPGLLHQAFRFGLQDSVLFEQRTTDDAVEWHSSHQRYLHAVSRLLDSVSARLPQHDHGKSKLNRDFGWNQRILFDLFSSRTSDALLNTGRIAANAPAL